MGQGRAALGRLGGDEGVEFRPHHLESRERAGQFRLQHAQQLGQGLEALDGEEAGVGRGGLGTQAQDRAGDDAQGALRADEQLLEVIAGVVLDQPVHRGDDRAVGQHRLQPQHHLAHHAVAQHPVAAGVGRDVAADGGRAAGAQVQRQEQARGVGGLAGGLQNAAGLHDHDRPGGVDLLDRVHPGQAERDGPLGRAAVHQAGEATPGDHGGAGGVGGLQNARDFVGGAGADDGGGLSEPGPGRVGLFRRSLAGCQAADADGGLQVLEQSVHRRPPVRRLAAAFDDDPISLAPRSSLRSGRRRRRPPARRRRDSCRRTGRPPSRRRRRGRGSGRCRCPAPGRRW